MTVMEVVSQVPRVSQIDHQQFYNKHFKPKQPVVITGMMDEWPAMKKWSFEFFSELGSSANVYVEKGNILQGQTDFQQAQLQDYLQALLADDEEKGQRKTYLSLFNVFSVFPELQNDIDFSLIRAQTFKNYVFAWLGPGGTLTGYHIDWADNILAQIHGHKRLYLVSPEQSAYMYPSSKYDYRSMLCSVDPDNYDREQYPLFSQIKPLETVLHPGEMIYIPRGWWHRVQSLEKSISVNNFGHDLAGLLYYQPRASLEQVLHRLGLYGSECTCHMMVDGKKVAR